MELLSKKYPVQVDAAGKRRGKHAPVEALACFALGCTLFLTVCAQGAGSNFPRAFRVPAPPDEQHPANCPGKCLENVTFKALSMGDLLDEEKTLLGFTAYQTSDGASVMELYQTFSSVSLAQAYLMRQLSRAAKVLNTGSKKDHRGRVIGKRGEVLMDSLTPGEINAAVLWTDGAHYEEIRSNSRCHVLELERRYTYGKRVKDAKRAK